MPSQTPPPFPSVPEEVEFSQGSFTNAQGFELATFTFVARGAKPTGIVLLLVRLYEPCPGCSKPAPRITEGLSPFLR